MSSEDQPKTVRVAAVQLAVTEDNEANLATCLRLIDQAADQGADPLETDVEALLLPPADYGVDSVREMVGGYPSQAPDEVPLDTIVVSGTSRRGRR